jgi:hypothetical protein
MKKVVRNNTGNSPSIQAAPVTTSTVHTVKLESRPQSTNPPTPVWSRYVDSRLKQFCLR